MRYVLLLLLLASAPAVAQVPTQGLVAYYSFSGDTRDQSGNGNDGVVVGAVPVTGRRGAPDQAFAFNGSTTLVELPATPFINDTYTYSLWVRPTMTTRTAQTLISVGNTGADQSLLLINGTQFPQPLWNMISYTNFTGSLATPVAVQTSTWRHIVAVRFLDRCLLYENGQLTGTLFYGTTAYPNYAASARALLGARSSGNNAIQLFDGLLDDVRIYNRALSVTEISALYRSETFIESVQAGNWTDPTTWSCQCQPAPGNTVVVRHLVSVSAGQTAQALRVNYDSGGQLTLGTGAQLRFAQ